MSGRPGGGSGTGGEARADGGEDAWPEGAADYVQAVSDTKLLLGQRYGQWSLAGPSLEDDIGGASAAQEEIGMVRQLVLRLEAQGRDGDWLRGDRDPEEFASAAPLDSIDGGWTEFLCTVAPVDRAALYLLDAIDHDDFAGLVRKIGEEEYFHLEYHDARLEALADEDAAAVEAAVEAVLPGTLAFVGPAGYDADSDPLYGSFTDRPVAEMREALLAHYDDLFAGTGVSLDGVDRTYPPAEEWDATRRRVGGGGPSEADVEQLTGARNAEFVPE